MVTIGIDEVGRGCWAGPLVAGAVILPSTLQLPVDVYLRDSKKLSTKQRQLAAIWIDTNAVAVGLGWVWPAEIDQIGITTSVKWAMERAAAAIHAPYDEIIIDGNINYFPENKRARALVKADATEPSVSAASIIAKVARDTYMAELGAHYAGYGFERHVGYGTAVHIAALQKLGVSPLHRRSFKPIQTLLKEGLDRSEVSF